MKIVYLSPVGVLGGAERSLLDLMASVQEADPAARLHLIAATGGELIRHAQALGIATTLLAMPRELVRLGDSAWKRGSRFRTLLGLTTRLPQAALSARRYAQRLAHTLAALEPDIVHSNGLKFHLLGQLAGLKSCPVVWHLRDFLSLHPLMKHALAWRAAPPQSCIAVSQAVARDARQILPRLPVDVVYNAIDTKHFSPGPGDGARLDRLAGLPTAGEGVIRIGLVAAFAYWKGHQVFLEAAARLVRQQPEMPARFYIIGGPLYATDGSQVSRRFLQARAAEAGIEHRVGFTGFQDDPAEIYRALDIVVHASTRPEPFGRTIVEGMACARAVIVTQAGGAGELFTPGHDALAVPRGDSPALAAAMHQLTGDRAARLKLAANARRTAVQRFDRKRLGHEILSVYHHLLAPVLQGAV